MLKVFQLRAARSTLGLGVRDIGAYIDLSRSTVSKIERMNIRSELNISHNQNYILLKIFNDKGVFFYDDISISYKNINHLYTGLLTRFQLRGSRAILGLPQTELSKLLSIERNDLNYLEYQDNLSYLDINKIELNQYTIKDFFIRKGIIFPNDGTISIKT